MTVFIASTAGDWNVFSRTLREVGLIDPGRSVQVATWRWESAIVVPPFMLMSNPLPDGCIHVVIEIPRGSRNKYEIDHETGRVFLDRRLFTATTYPADYGYIPDTLGGDGDPLDALVLLEDPVYPGVWVQARPLGVLYMHDEAGEDAKIICVPPREPRWQDVMDLSDLTPQLVEEIQHFFEVYKALEPGKTSSTAGLAGREAAWREIEESRRNFTPRH